MEGLLFNKLKKVYIRKKLKFLLKKYNLSKDLFELFIKKLKGLELHFDSVKTLFVGSSHLQMAINTNLFEKYSAYSLSIGSQDLYYSYKLYEKYASKLPKLKNIIVSFSVFSSGYELEKSVNKNMVYCYNYIFDIPPKSLSDKILKSKKDMYFIENNIKFEDIDKNYTGYDKSISTFNKDIAIRDVKGHIKNALRENNQTDYINKFKELAENFGHNFYVVITPHSLVYREKLELYKQDYNAQDKDLFLPLKQTGVEIWNYFEDKNFDDDDFMDWEHILPNAAKVFTHKIMGKLQNKKLGVN